LAANPNAGVNGNGWLFLRSLEDWLLVFAGLFIATTVFRLYPTWLRIRKLLRSKWAHSKLKNLYMDIKFGPSRWLSSTKGPKINKSIFQRLSFDSQAKIFSYVDPKDLLELSMMSKQTRNHMLNTKMIWIPLYKNYVSPNLPKDMNLIGPLLEKYKQLKNIQEDSLLRDRKIGVYGIIQEEFLFSVFILPQLVSLPMKLFGKFLLFTNPDPAAWTILRYIQSHNTQYQIFSTDPHYAHTPNLPFYFL
jgi:hypothetical protein